MGHEEMREKRERRRERHVTRRLEAVQTQD